MKRITLLGLVAVGLASITGCDEVKRRALDAGRAVETRAIDRADEAGRKKANETVDSAANKATGEDEGSSKKRDKLKAGKDDDE